MSLEEEIGQQLNQVAVQHLMERVTTSGATEDNPIAMSPDEMIGSVLLPMITAQQNAILRLAQEIDKLRSK
jgi:hypothetical protein